MELSPSSGPLVGVGSGSDVGSVNVGMANVRLTGVERRERLRGASRVVAEGIDPDDTGDGRDPGVRQVELACQPVAGYDGVGVGGGEPGAR